MPELSHMEIIKEISKQTSLSTSSVYKILHNPFDFAPDTAKRVLQLADDFGYRTSKKSEKKTHRINVLIPSRPSYYWREAMKGMKDAQRDIKRLNCRQVELCFNYLHLNLGDEALCQFYADALHSDADGYIILPLILPECISLIEEKSKKHPVILFNECHSELLLKHFPNADKLNHQNIASVSPDIIDEGCAAFHLIEKHLRKINHLVFISIRSDLRKNTTSVLRTESFRHELLQAKPTVKIDYVNIEFATKITPSFLSRKLYDIQLREPIDCVYISTGLTYTACAAIEKLKKRLGENVRIFCVGHECSPSNLKYIEQGIQLGYVKQDVYKQGYDSVMMLCHYLNEGTPLKDRFYRSICRETACTESKSESNDTTEP